MKKSSTALLLFIAAFLLALLSSEGGLALMGYLLAYAFFMENGTWRKKVTSMIPSVTITITYLTFYLVNHYGAQCNTAYLSPLDAPALTIITIFKNTVLLSLSQILSIPFLSGMLQMIGSPGMAVAVGLSTLLFVVFRKFLVSNRTIAFFGTGMVLSIVPYTLAFISDRVLLWAGLGAAGLLGELFTTQIALRSTAQRILARTLLVNNVVVSGLCFAPMLLLSFSLEKDAFTLEKAIPAENTVLLNSSANGFSFMYSPAIRYKKGGTWPAHFYCLYSDADTLTVRRTGEQTLLAISANGWLNDPFFKDQRPKELRFRQGDTRDLQLMIATIEKVSADSRPLSVSFTFKRKLSEFAWLKWTANGVERCELPEIGDEIKLCAPAVL